MYQMRMIPGTYCIAVCLFVSGWWYHTTFRPWTHTSDDSYIYQLSLVVVTKQKTSRQSVSCFLFLLLFFFVTFTFQLNLSEVSPATIFSTSRGHSCRPFSPRYVPSILIAHRAQHTYCSTILIECR